MDYSDKCEVCGDDKVVQKLTTKPSQMEMDRYEIYFVGRCEEHKIDSLANDSRFTQIQNVK